MYKLQVSLLPPTSVQIIATNDFRLIKSTPLVYIALVLDNDHFPIIYLLSNGLTSLQYQAGNVKLWSTFNGIQPSIYTRIRRYQTLIVLANISLSIIASFITHELDYVLIVYGLYIYTDDLLNTFWTKLDVKCRCGESLKLFVKAVYWYLRI